MQVTREISRSCRRSTRSRSIARTFGSSRSARSPRTAILRCTRATTRSTFGQNAEPLHPLALPPSQAPRKSTKSPHPAPLLRTLLSRVLQHTTHSFREQKSMQFEFGDQQRSCLHEPSPAAEPTHPERLEVPTSPETKPAEPHLVCPFPEGSSRTRLKEVQHRLISLSLKCCFSPATSFPSNR